MSGSKNPLKSGDRVGALVLLAEDGRSADGHKVWICVCDCGKECRKQSGALRNTNRLKKVSSCGCIGAEIQRLKSTTHGMRGTSEYRSWQAAKRRCLVQNDKDYPKYGGRGIMICDEWANSFEAFYEHMGPRPKGTTLERKNTNGNYEPGNCKWANAVEQARNRRKSIHIEWKGEIRHLSIVAEDLGITYGAAFQRLKRGKLYENN